MTARRAILPFLVCLALAAGCSRVPRIIVLEDPLSAAEHVDLGVAYEKKGEVDLARREYEKALRKDGKCFQARVNLGNLFLQGKEYEKAREEYLRALKLRPGDLEATNNLSWTAVFLGKGIEEALARMEDAAAAPGGRRPEILDTLGVLRMHSNRPVEADEAFAAAEGICAGMGEPSGEKPAAAPCTEEVRREIGDHRLELRKRFPSAFPPSNR